MKATHAVLASLLFTSAICGQTTNCVSPPPDLVSWWRAEGTALDSRGTNHGTASSVTNYAPGKVGLAFKGMVYVQDSPSLRFTNALTIEGWVNPSRVDGLRTIVSKLGARVPLLGLNVSNSYYLGISNGGFLYFSISTNGTDRLNALLRSLHAVPTNQWTHVAATFGAGTMRLYLNGQQDTETNFTGALFPGEAQFGIGGIPYPSGDLIPGPSSLFAGMIDELAVYRRELSEFEIRALYTAGGAGKCPPASPSCAAPPPGLVSWWRGEKSAADNWDSNNGLTPVGLLTATGKVGQAFFSPGQRYVIVPDSVSLRFTNAMTIEAWVNPSAVASSLPQTIVSKFDYPPGQLITSGQQSSYLLGLTNGGRVFFTASATGSARTNTTLLTAQVVPANQWTFVVATYDGTHLRIYLNGNLVGSRDHFGGIFPGSDDLGIGAMPYLNRSYYWPFPGLLDEVSLYNRALSAAEILAIYSADSAGKCLAVPSITAQPQDQSIPLGEDVKFSADVLGTRPITCQWRFNGVVIPGATNTALVLEKVKTNQAGFYHVTVTNALGFVVSARAQLTLLPAPTCLAAPDRLISWWPADGSGADAMGANHLSQFSGITYLTGKVDRAFGFNGVSSFLVALNATSLNFGSNADFTIELWVKAGVSNSTYPNIPLIEKRTGYGGPIIGVGAGYSLSLDRGRLAFWLGGSGLTLPANNRQFISDGPDVRDGMFHHLAVTLERGDTNGGKLYVDGAVVMTFDPTFWRGSLANTASFSVGSVVSYTTDSRFGGLIDEPAVYGRALSGAEILAIRNAGAAGRCKVRPTIVTQPISQRVTIGSNVTFSVSASGSPALRYQWLRNGALISPATNTSYSFTVSEASAGNYSARVTNLFGFVTSSNAVLIANHRPFIDATDVALNEDTPTQVRFLFMDTDKDPLTIIIVTPPAHGSVIGTVTNLIYTPASDYFGPDRFIFKVNDGLADSNPGTVNVTVRPINDAPEAQSQSVSLDEDTSTAITLGAFDVDGDTITFTVGSPAHGTLSGIPPNLNYRPTTNYFGPDSFTFQINDGKTNSNVATVSLTVRPLNDTPFARLTISPLVTNVPGTTNWVVIAAVCDDARVVLDGSASSDVENDPLNYTWLDGTNVIAAGVIATNFFAPGSHELVLQAGDGQAVGTATAAVEVITPAQGVGIVIVLLSESDLGRRNIQPLIASLKNAAAALEQCNAKPGVNQLEAFKHKVRAQVAPLNQALADQLIAVVDQLLSASR